jgi:aryl-alcohol dehydrogenase-like predicted oxidoreductase
VGDPLQGAWYHTAKRCIATPPLPDNCDSSEEIVGRAMREFSSREQIILATFSEGNRRNRQILPAPSP